MYSCLILIVKDMFVFLPVGAYGTWKSSFMTTKTVLIVNHIAENSVYRRK
jgi:hypothetical protein